MSEPERTAPGPPEGHPFADAETILMITLDTLRFDAAQTAWRSGGLQTLARHLPDSGWERRHSPASFTYAAHHAYFSGFLPTPVEAGPHRRLFSPAFAGSESIADTTYVFPEATLPQALSAQGHRTICIGGTGFFNGGNSLSSVLPSLFDERHWDERLGVTDRRSEQNQVALAARLLDSSSDPIFLFLNVAAIHQPNWFYGPLGNGTEDPPVDKRVESIESHTAALCAVDSALETLFDATRRRGPAYCIICSDHGTTYGEDGYRGHRIGHRMVWDVPYTEFAL